MYKNKKGFTLGELVIVILVVTVLLAVVAPSMIRSTAVMMKKAHAAADAASLRSSITNVSAELLEGKTMGDISSSMSRLDCESDPEASLWINYNKPISLSAYFVDIDRYYSIEYLSEVALNGSSELETKEPLTLGFWYEAGAEN